MKLLSYCKKHGYNSAQLRSIFGKDFSKIDRYTPLLSYHLNMFNKWKKRMRRKSKKNKYNELGGLIVAQHSIKSRIMRTFSNNEARKKEAQRSRESNKNGKSYPVHYNPEQPNIIFTPTGGQPKRY